MVRYLRYVGGGFRLAHTIWALLAASLCVLLVVGGGGHPPPIIFLPVVLVIWCLGHVALWGIRRLEARGRELTPEAKGERGSWPLGLIIALIGTGIVVCVGLVQLGGTLFLGKWYIFADTLWAIAMAVSLAHAACFVGLLLRRPWSRPATAVLSIGWALLLVWQISEQLVHGHRINLAAYVTLFGGIALLSFLGYHILFSRRIRAFFGPE